MRQPAGNIIQEAPLSVSANLRQRALDAAIAEIKHRTGLLTLLFTDIVDSTTVMRTPLIVSVWASLSEPTGSR